MMFLFKCVMFGVYLFLGDENFEALKILWDENSSQKKLAEKESTNTQKKKQRSKVFWGPIFLVGL